MYISAVAEGPEPTILLLCQVVLLHPVGCELVGRCSRKSGSVRTLDTQQQQQRNGGQTADVSQQHDVTSFLGAVPGLRGKDDAVISFIRGRTININMHLIQAMLFLI